MKRRRYMCTHSSRLHSSSMYTFALTAFSLPSSIEAALEQEPDAKELWSRLTSRSQRKEMKLAHPMVCVKRHQ